MAKIIMHIDLNAFFVSCEILLNPSLEGKPVAVGGSYRRGVISTASYEARKKGVYSSQAIYQAKKLCPDLILLNGNYDFYQKKSAEFFSYIKNNVTPLIEMASIDEAFVDLTSVLNKEKEPEIYLRNLQKTLKETTGLGCSIGVGCSKFIAKMASDYQKPMGLTIIRNKEIKKYLFPLPIKDLFMVGKKSVQKLKALGINTIGDFYYYDKNELIKIMGKTYDYLINALNGNGDDEVSTIYNDPKSISSSVTFMFDTTTYAEIEDSLKYQVKDIVKQLKQKNMLAATIHITIRNREFKTITRSKTLTHPLEKEEEILSEILSLFDKNWDGSPLRLVGASLSNLSLKDNYYAQLNLFTLEKDQKECETRLLINNLNRKSNKDFFMTLHDYEKKKVN